MVATVQANSRVLSQVEITLDDGTLLESSRQQGKPTLFCLGDGSLSAALEQQLLGLTVADGYRFSLPASAVLGEFNPDLVRHFSRLDFNQITDLAEGMVILFDGADGSEQPGIVKTIIDDSVTVDFNPPFIKQIIHFHIDILSIESASEA